MREQFNNFLETNLNQPQQEAVTNETGPMLVVAGAGSGKTRIITTRITHLILNKNVPPYAIVALTFTNKAALEMKERIASFLGANATMPFIGTFHSYCVQILKRYNDHLLYPFNAILDSDDQQKMLQSILTKHSLNKQFTAKSVAHHISQMKNHTVDPSSPATEYLPHPMLTQILNAYESEKRASKCLDFDDLILETLRLLKTNTIVRNLFQEKIRHILVDEYQDTNAVQHELLKIMSLDNNALAINSLCAVGDEDQSIYSWRGATVTNMLEFKKVFPDTKTITIEQNYRSVQPILNLANHAIQRNNDRTPKNLWSEKQGTNRILQLQCLTEYQEARAIAQLLTIAKDKYGLSNIGILYRTHTQSRAIEEALLKESIPYRIIGGIQFYERKEIKDLIAYLKIIANPFDRVSFFRVINVPTRGLGEKFENDFYHIWSEQPFSTWQDIIHEYIKTGILGKAKTASLEKFLTLFEGIETTEKTSNALELLIKRTNYIAYIQETNEPAEIQARLENIKELIEALKYFEENGTTTISRFLEDVALMQDQMSKQNRSTHAVSLMTLHAAKGLEFDLVILPGLEETIIPTTRSLNLNSTVEEERRLFYVGITRAKEHLLITHAKHRYSYGKMTDQLQSRFLEEVEHLLPLEECSYWSLTQINQFLSQWIHGKTTQTDNVYIPPKYSPKPLVTNITTSSINIITENSEIKPTTWKKNQPVKHEKYGIGTIQEIEEKKSGDTFLTVRFKASIKKILSQFLHKL